MAHRAILRLYRRYPAVGAEVGPAIPGQVHNGPSQAASLTEMSMMGRRGSPR